jgi:predicted ATP-dependent protease
MDISKFKVPVENLKWHCDPKIFDFKCTKDIAPLQEFVGQERATRALEFGLFMNRPGYNIYVAGIAGTGKTSMVKSYIKQILDKSKKGAPDDWCYVYDFSNRDTPQIINLPAGWGKVLKNDIRRLKKNTMEGLSRAFSSDDYNSGRKKIIEENRSEQGKLLEQMGEKATQEGFLFQMTSSGPVLAPLVDGQAMSRAAYLELDKQQREELEKKRQALTQKLDQTFEKVREIDRKIGEKLTEYDKKVAEFTTSRLFNKLNKKYVDMDLDKVKEFLKDLKNFVLENLDIFKQEQGPQHGQPQAFPLIPIQPNNHGPGQNPFVPFYINLFVDNSKFENPPVVTEINPNYTNLFGRIERKFIYGGYLSDHTMLKPGAVHLANGGYLLLNAKDVVTNPMVWPALKRAIQTGELRIEDPFEQFGIIPPQGLRPQPMPLDIKVILLGQSFLYQLLSLYDEDFWEIFRVKADFDSEVERTDKNLVDYAAFIAGCCEECKPSHFDSSGVARMLEFASRLVSDQEKLSSRFALIKEMVEESVFWAQKDGADMVTKSHVEKAIEEKRFRHDLPDEKILEMIRRGQIMIDVDGAVVGQVNGLSVYLLGDIIFGKPSKITCKTFMGQGGVINIERESKLSGKIHDKGVMILTGYMGSKFAQDKPLSLSASLCFEQSYEGVDGDSASSAEIYALLSSISGIPLRQDIAVTGSVNQNGEIQPVGGVNQKIEGFFKVCRAIGLTGNQGVVIPGKNMVNLTLNTDLIEAVKKGEFHIYAVNTIDEGIGILTDMEAGEQSEDGTYPEGSLNFIVNQKLREMAEKMKKFQMQDKKASNNNSE